ncbi:MAG: hypothetical protein Q6366_012755 [Candidatus Freyarchaeota archaeon]|nr:hypothetical protein [Candidatus Jordarchaeia archaeon]MBS7269931.1 hypothetical protein [Candidatus Jordarchaeia archaeon]MBS7280146.1 hypothetical protein [Candidatus Jordarchaeia archaeon]
MSEKYITLTKRFLGKWKWNCLICSLDIDPAKDAGNVYQCTKCRYMMHLDELKSWMASRNTKKCPLCGYEVEIES